MILVAHAAGQCSVHGCVDDTFSFKFVAVPNVQSSPIGAFSPNLATLTAWGGRRTSDKILKMCQQREEHMLIANVSFWHDTHTGFDHYRQTFSTPCSTSNIRACARVISVYRSVVVLRRHVTYSFDGRTMTGRDGHYVTDETVDIFQVAKQDDKLDERSSSSSSSSSSSGGDGDCD